MNFFARGDELTAERVVAVDGEDAGLVCQFGTDMTLTYVSDRFCTVFGRNRADLIAAGLDGIVNAECLERLAKTCRALSPDRREASIECQGIRDRSVSQSQLWTVLATFDTAGSPTSYSATIRDISESRRYQQALEELMDVASRRDGDIDRSIRGMLAVGCRYYDVSNGILGHAVGDMFEFAHLHAPDLQMKAGAKRELSETYAGIVLDTGDLVAIPNVSRSVHAERQAHDKFGLNTFLGAPVDVGGSLKTVVGFGDTRPRDRAFTAEERNFLTIAAHWIGLEFERHQNRMEIERSRNELQFIFDQLPARIWYKDDQNRILRLNRAAARFIGMEPHEAEGRHVTDLFSNETRDYHEDDMDVFDSDEPHLGVLEDMTSEVGKRNWALVDKVPYCDEKTGARSLLIVANDITETMRYRNALEDLMDLANQAHDDLAETLQGILAIGCDYYGLTLGTVSRFEQGRFEVEQAVAADGEPAESQIAALHRVSREVAQSSAPIAVHDAAVLKLHEPGDGTDARPGCFVAAPLFVDGRSYGVLSFSSAAPRPEEISKDEINFIKLAAHWVGVEFERHQAVRGLRHTEQQLRKANNELLRQQDDFRSLYRRTPVMMHSIDNQGRIVEVSEKWLGRLGYDRDEVIGRKSSEFLSEESAAQAVQEVLPEFFRTGRCDAVPYQFICRNGDEVPVELSAILDFNGPEGERSLAVLDDVTKRKQAQAALERRNTDLERANENLKQFAHVASHDLQEPLRKIQAFSDLVREAAAEGNRDELEYGLEVLAGAATRSRELVSDLLAFSRATNDGIECHPVSIGEVLTEVMQNLQVQIEETGARITDNTGGAVIDADRSLLHRLLLNLLSNSMKYQAPGSTPEITIATEIAAGGSPVSLSVVDNGIGFDPAFRDRIFEPFKRLHTRVEYPGTGIGLAICLTAVRRHGWTITADSNPGKGSTFRVDLSARA